MNKKDVREKLAELCHDQWSGWMKYLFSKTYPLKSQFDIETGDMIIPKSFTERWQRQMNTEYKDLSDPEKESDRREADKFISFMYMDDDVADIVDISNTVSAEEIPMCPLCDNEIEESDGMCLVKSNGLVAMAHEFCVTEFTDVEEI